jgi:rubrerythrin
MKTIGVDPEKIIAEQDPDVVSRAANYGCDVKHIRLAIEYVNAKIFNDKMYKRNRHFERDSPNHVTRNWIKEWLKDHPNHIDEIDWQNHTVESRHAHFKDLAVDYEEFQRYKAFYHRWHDEDSYQQMITTVHDMGIMTRETYECAQCGYRMMATNKICPFCRRHVPEFACGMITTPQSMSGSTRMIQRLAKSMIIDKSRPGFSFPFRGVHSIRWQQIKTLVKLDTSWREKRTWKYNSVNPGQPFTSLMDRIRKDPVFLSRI